MWTRYKKTLKQSLLRAFAVIDRLKRTENRSILLTFDDGPHPDVTPRVLDRLKDHGARAVFFVVGNRISRAPHLLSCILAEGHLIGNHTYTHPLDGEPSLLDYVKDVSRCQDAIRELTGWKPKLFRPPLGSLTLVSLIAPKVLGLKAVYWSVDSGDWRLRDPAAAAECGERLAELACPRDILLLHDDNPRVIPVLDIVLPYLASRGYDLGSAVDHL